MVPTSTSIPTHDLFDIQRVLVYGGYDELVVHGVKLYLESVF